MKYSIVFLFAIASVLSGLAQEKPVNQVLYKDKLYWLYPPVDTGLNNTPYKYWFRYDLNDNYLGWKKEFPKDGDWINFFKLDTTKVASIFRVENGLLTGKSTQYSFGGRLESEVEFLRGEPNGFTRYWNDSGLLVLEKQYKLVDYGHFLAPVLIGQSKSWNNDGSLYEIKNFNNEGELDGVHLIYHDNGNIRLEEFFKKGEQDSTQTYLHDNAQIKSQQRFENGLFIPDSVSYEYHPNGKVAATGKLPNRRKLGNWKFYYDNGQLRAEGEFGTYTFQHDHGDIFMPIKIGIWKYYYSSGELMASGSYLDEIIFEVSESDNFETKTYQEKKDDWLFYDANGNAISLEAFEKLNIVLEVN